MHTAELRFEYRSPEAAVLVTGAIEGEVGEIDSDRAKARPSRRGKTIRVCVEAEDLVALRAGVNTWETLLEVAERSAELGRPGVL